jgi:hypothetical protein
MRCIAYDFDSGFYTWSDSQKDEEGKEILNIEGYYE